MGIGSERMRRLLPEVSRASRTCGLWLVRCHRDVDDPAISARRGEMRVPGKGRDGGKVGSVLIHPELRPLLAAWLTERPCWRGADARGALRLNAGRTHQ